MKILAEILKKEGIKSKEDFILFMKTKNKIKDFELIKTIDSDENVIQIQNKIIDLSEISFSKFFLLSINNCIFTGKVKILQDIADSDKKCKIEIENSIFLEDTFIGSKNKSSSIEIYHSNFSYLSFNSLKTEELIIHHSKIFMLNIENVNINFFDTENNKIEYMEIKNYQIDKINFGFEQINKNFIKNRLDKKIFGFSIKEYSKLNFNINLFEFIKFYNENDLKNEVHYNSLNNILEFVKDKTNVSKNKTNLNEILFWETFLAQENPFNKLFIWITRAFFYPERFLVFGGIIFFVFSLIYTIPLITFNVDGNIKTLSFLEALYFSAVTFTTVGYGDIFPIGVSRFFAVSEAFLGIIVMNTFLVSLLKKYID